MSESQTHPLDTDLATTLRAVEAATERYLATVARLQDADFATPSVLPGWSVAHVISHVASNATGISASVISASHGEPVAVYATNAARDAEIDERAALPVSELRALNASSCDDLSAAIAACPADRLEVLLPRVVDGPAWSVLDWMGARWREVEIHHTDMGVGYTHQEWTDDFVDYLFKVAAFDREPEVSLTLRSPEGDARVGGGGAVIEGSRRDLLWWLIGRGDGVGVTGDLPALAPWNRRTRY